MNTGALERIGFVPRLVAWLIDAAVIWVASVLILFLFAGSTGLAEATSSGILRFLSSGVALLLLGLNFLLQFFYFGYFWSRGGQSLGMKIMNARVVRQETGEGLSFWRAGLRGTVGYYISSLVFSLGYLWALFDRDNETWHDKVFDTWVVRNRWVG